MGAEGGVGWCLEEGGEGPGEQLLPELADGCALRQGRGGREGTAQLF